MEFAATIKDCEQYAPDGFQDVTRVKKITPATTIQELIDWELKLFPGRAKTPSKYPFLSIQIVQVEE